jgi:cytochrome c5
MEGRERSGERREWQVFMAEGEHTLYSECEIHLLPLQYAAAPICCQGPGLGKNNPHWSPKAKVGRSDVKVSKLEGAAGMPSTLPWFPSIWT